MASEDGAALVDCRHPLLSGPENQQSQRNTTMRSAKELTLETWMAAFRNGTRITGAAPESTPMPGPRREPAPAPSVAMDELELAAIDEVELVGAF